MWVISFFLPPFGIGWFNCVFYNYIGVLAGGEVQNGSGRVHALIIWIKHFICSFPRLLIDLFNNHILRKKIFNCRVGC